MAELAPPLLMAIVLWWASTGAILWLVRRPESSFGPSLAAFGCLAGLAAAVVTVAARSPSQAAAYLGFGAALVLWGWHEAGFLMGVVTGPRRSPCPSDARGWVRFRVASETLIHHELALVLTAVGVVVLSWGAPNPVGALTFLTLLALRLSTKLNLFLGVPNLPITFLPPRLAYLASYFRRRRFNALLPVSLALSAALMIGFARAALAPSAAPADVVGYGLLLGLAALGLLEHLFLITPSPDRALWGWALGARAEAPPVLALAGGNPETPTTGGRP